VLGPLGDYIVEPTPEVRANYERRKEEKKREAELGKMRSRLVGNGWGWAWGLSESQVTRICAILDETKREGE
jgi:hypothetical protein